MHMEVLLATTTKCEHKTHRISKKYLQNIDINILCMITFAFTSFCLSIGVRVCRGRVPELWGQSSNIKCDEESDCELFGDGRGGLGERVHTDAVLREKI